MFFQITKIIIVTFIALIGITTKPLLVNAQDEIVNDSLFLEERIAKNYSKKICNAIGIGLSKESAIKLSILENKESKFNPSLWIEIINSGDKNISRIDNSKLYFRISEEVVSECGYPLKLKGSDGINLFYNEFIKIKEDLG